MGNTLQFDDAGKRLALLVVGDNYETVNLHIWEADTGELISQSALPIPAEFFRFDLSPNWQTLAVGRENGIPELWDVATGEQLLTFPGHNEAVRGIAFNTDGSRMVTTSADGLIQVWNVQASLAAAEGQLELAFATQNERGLGKSFFSHDGTHLALLMDTIIEVWDLTDTSRPQLTLTGHNNAVLHAAFTADDSQLATAAADSTAKVWDLITGQELFTLAGHKDSVVRLAFSPDGRFVATASDDGTARFWNAARDAGGELETFIHPEVIFSADLKLSPDEQKYALGGLPGPATIWDAETGEQLLTFQDDMFQDVVRVAFHPNGSRLATVGGDGMLRLWDTNSGERILQFITHMGGNAGGNVGTLDVAFSPDGNQLATAGADGLAKVWDAATGEELLVLAGHTAGLFSLVYSPDGRYIATISDWPDTTVNVWDAVSGEVVHTFGPNPGRAWGLAISPDGQLLAAGGVGGFLKVWDMKTGEEVSNLTGQSSEIGSILFTQDGQRLISGGVNGVSVWDVEMGTELLNLTPVNSRQIALTHDERRLYMIGGMAPNVKVNTVQLEDTISLAESRLTRWWAVEECRQYLHTDYCPVEK